MFNEKTIIGKFSEVTDEQCLEIVHQLEDVGYRYYLKDEIIRPASLNWEYQLKSPKESLKSLLLKYDILIKDWHEFHNPKCLSFPQCKNESVSEREQFCGCWKNYMIKHRSLRDDVLIFKLEIKNPCK